MPLLEKINKKQLIWGIAILASILIAVTVIWLVARNRPAPATPPPETTEPTTEAQFALDEKGYMTGLNAEYAVGIDVSQFQGTIDWSLVKSAGIEFVFIRIGGRGTSEGTLYADTAAAEYYEGAKAAGLQVGAYFYSQAISAEEAEEEARYVLEQIVGWELELPLMFDWEWVSHDARTANVDRSTLTEATLAFCNMIETAGYEPGIYFNTHQGLHLLDMDKLQGYKLWLARYDMFPDFPHQVDFWQYSCTGQISGIEGDVDMNLMLYIP